MILPRLVYSMEGDDEPELHHGKPVVRVQFPNIVTVEALGYADYDGWSTDPKTWTLHPRHRHGVLGLSKKRIEWVLKQRFAVPYEAITSITFLWYEAATLWEHPLLQHFDTVVRESLSSVAVESMYRGFYLLGDYIIDGEHDNVWCRLATYLFWATSDVAGAGLPYSFAKLDDPIVSTELQEEILQLQQKAEETS